jgi:hypothetical protein
MRRAGVVLLVAGVLVCASSAAAATPAQNHAAAKAMLSRCLAAANGLIVGPVTLNTPEVPQRNRQQQAAYGKCQNTKITNLAFAHPKDALLEAARIAFDDLELGLGDYGQYLVDAAFGKHDTSLLHQAEHEVASGKAEARKILPRL